MSETESHISLIDLRKQFAFDIDDKAKKALCFAETLVISCTHYEGYTESSESSRTSFRASESSGFVCSSTTSEPEVVPEEHTPPPLPEPLVEEEQEMAEEDEPFAFYFFPDCNQPLPKQRSDQSVIVGPDGMPMINPSSAFPKWCRCKRTKKGVCECFVKIPCNCGARTHAECTCGQEKEICICENRNPAPKCICKKRKEVCTCFPGAPQPYCICKDVEKPCICKKGFPSPICECKSKPWLTKKDDKSKPISSLGMLEGLDEDSEEGMEEEEEFEEELEEEIEHETVETEEASGEETRKKRKSRVSRITSKSKIFEAEKLVDEQPCTCQQPDRKPCTCREGEKCVCMPTDDCTCGKRNECVCPLTDDPYMMPCAVHSCVSKPICECPVPRICTCDSCHHHDNSCKCFPKKKDCRCEGNPDECVCLKVCDCKAPCICDVQSTPKTCICDVEGQLRSGGVVCTCPKPTTTLKLKKVRVGKQGWRFCPEVDPHHTFFDYAYGRHHLIEQKEQEKEKFKILGIYSEKEDECPIHKEQLPHFQKKVRKPSLDCCSAVGGLTISVESLGEEADKFLVNVISHASKEGAKTESKLVAIIDLNLHTLEENRVESITKGDITKERKSYFAICDVGYYNKVTRICGERNSVKRLYHKYDQAKDFLLEGANLVLMRYLALTRYKGSLKTRTVLIDGSICESIYVCLGVSQAIVNGRPLFVVKIERTIVEASGFMHQTLTVLSLRGYMISHEWHDNNYMLHLNPLLHVVPEKDLIEDHAPLREKWREDLQLFSDFLDHKASRSGEGARYISESGALTTTVRDYLQAILMLKPHDVLHFTRHYFDSVLSAIDLPREEYFDPCPKHVRYFYMES